MLSLIPSFITQQYKQNKNRGAFLGTTLFVDISGFTPLTEQLMQHGTEGGEILTDILAFILNPMVEQVYSKGGVIPHFAGDAFTAIFAGNQTKSVTAIASRIKKRFDKTPLLQTPYGNFTINVRIGLSYGLVEWGIVGESLKTFYFKGSAIERATQAQKLAEPQQIIVDKWFRHIATPTAPSQVFDTASPTEFKTTFITYQELSSYSDVDEWVSLQNHNVIEERDYEPFLTQINQLSFHTQGEFRDVVAVFISFFNLTEYNIISKVSAVVLKEFGNYGGYFKEIDFCDVNATMVGFFGAPVSYENNIARALECVLTIREALNSLTDTDIFKFRMGLTHGRTFTGIVGGDKRCQYAAVGNSVNLAARLMQNAAWGDIIVDSSLAGVRSFDYVEKGTIQYKGITSAIPTYQLLRKHVETKPLFVGRLMGRDKELDSLYQYFQKVKQEKKGAFTTIFGEAGVGKSRLIYGLRQHIEGRHALMWLTCPADPILKKPFNPFIGCLNQIFQQNPEKSVEQNQETFDTIFNKILCHCSVDEDIYTSSSADKTTQRSSLRISEGQEGELSRTKPVFEALLGLHISGSLWLQLDAKGRYDNIQAALESLFLCLSYTKPLVVEIEDVQWLDDDSVLLLRNLCKKIVHKPIWIISSARYDDEGTKIPIIEPLYLTSVGVRYGEIELTAFSKNQLLDYAVYILTQLSQTEGTNFIDADFAETLWRATNGNPFYVEQIMGYMIDNNLIHAVKEGSHIEKRWVLRNPNIKISNSISALLMSRIDRLSALLKETVKTAAVIGKEFDLPVLSEVLQSNEEYLRQNGKAKLLLREQIQNAEKGQIWMALNDMKYSFKHALMREAVYDMQLKTRLREQHILIAKAIERLYSNHLEDKYIDLAFHYEQSGNKKKTAEYLKKAAQVAVRNFQNQQAIDLYDRLLKIEKETSQIVKILVQKGETCRIVGQWETASICFEEALALAEDIFDIRLKGSVYDAVGSLLMLKGHHKQAQTYFEKAVTCYVDMMDNLGIAQTYGNLGNLYFRQGEYEQAKDYFTKNISLCRDNNWATNPHIVSHLGLTHMNQSNYTEGVRCQEEALTICTLNNDLAGMANIHINLGIVLSEKGDYDTALHTLEEGVTLAQKLGNKQLTAIALGCVGNVWLHKGDFEKASEYLNQDFKMTEELGDKQGMAIACELLGKLNSARGMFEEAIAYYQNSLNLCYLLGYQKGIAKALHSLGEVHAYECDFLKALDCFDKAIEIARKINNSLILGNCLIDKGSVLIKLGDVSGALAIKEELSSTLDFSENSRLFYYAKPFLNKL